MLAEAFSILGLILLLVATFFHLRAVFVQDVFESNPNKYDDLRFTYIVVTGLLFTSIIFSSVGELL